MNFIRFACTAVLLLGVAEVSAAQSASNPVGQSASNPVGTSGSIGPEFPVAVSGIDITRLPIDVKRIEQRFRQGQIREERDGLNLRYFVDVFAKSPTLVLLTKEDNLFYGQVPNSAPSHADMLEMMTPREYRNHGGVNILGSGSKKK